jgi:hypothetical protein
MLSAHAGDEPEEGQMEYQSLGRSGLLVSLVSPSRLGMMPADEDRAAGDGPVPPGSAAAVASGGGGWPKEHVGW